MQNLNFNASVKEKNRIKRVANLCGMHILSVGQKIAFKLEHEELQKSL